MLKKVKRLMKSLRRNTSGNVLFLFAAGAPALIGGAGLAVDTAQWYMWKREMQYAVDQAAMAAAWSRVGGTTGNEYRTRAQQELTANLQVVDFQGTPSITLEQWNTSGAANSVKVSLRASRELPFSKLLMGHGTTIAVSAQARFEKASAFTACLIAVDPSTRGAITFAGNAYLIAKCGVAALSNNENAITQSGQGYFNVGYLVAAGGIDDQLQHDQNNTYTNVLFEGQQGLVDPFKDLTPPNNSYPRTYACASTTTYVANYTITTAVESRSYTATSNNPYNWTGPASTTVSGTQTGSEPATSTTQVNTKNENPATPVVSPVQAGTPQAIPGTSTTKCTGPSDNRVCTTTTTPTTYKRVDTVTTTTKSINSISSTSSPAIAAMQPGTYSDFTVACDTTMAPGVYVINGGSSSGFTVHSQYSVKSVYPNGAPGGVMIVLKNHTSLDINGGSSLDLRAMSYPEMVDPRYGNISPTEALKLKDMLIFEDRDSGGATNDDKLNGSAGAKLTGTIYLPKSSITFNGTLGVTSGCLVITAKTIAIGGTANMASFCDGGDGTGLGVSVGGGNASVSLVA